VIETIFVAARVDVDIVTEEMHNVTLCLTFCFSCSLSQAVSAGRLGKRGGVLRSRQEAYPRGTISHNGSLWVAGNVNYAGLWDEAAGFGVGRQNGVGRKIRKAQLLQQYMTACRTCRTTREV